jgi:hypothetical protein
MKKQLHVIILIAALLTTGSKTFSQAVRGMYVNQFSSILGNAVKEDSLLNYARDSSFNYMALYNLSSLNFSSQSDMNKLSSFISRARTTYGITQIGAVSETFAQFRDKIVPYNNSHTANERFNVFNLEFEFWINASVNAGGVYCVNYLTQANCSCDTSGAFYYYINLLRQVDSIATANGAISETYIGWFNQGQGAQIQQNISRILLHAYRIDASSVFSYSKTRMGHLASNNTPVTIIPIFSAEPSFMGPWLTSGHGQMEAYNKYVTDFTADNSSWKQYVNIGGYQWFAQSYLPKPAPGSFNPVITASGATSFCAGGSVTLTATTGNTYHWSNGATTQSITVTTSGNFSCDVTLNGNTMTTSATTVTVNNAPSASVIVNTPVGVTVPLTSNTSAGSGTINSYQWKLNGANITGATNNGYTVTVNGNYSLAVTNTNGCGITSSSATVSVPFIFIPVVTASGSTSFCAGGSVTLTATTGNTYLWNNGATTQSITVTTSGNFSCDVTLNGNTVTTAATTVTVYNLPSATVNENTPVGLTVPLTSNTSAGSGTINSFQWKRNSTSISGATSSDYVATADGDYTLAITNTFGCAATSATESVTVPIVTCVADVPTATSSYSAIGNTITLHWNVASGDSIVIRYKPEYTSTYTYIRMLNTSQTTFTLSGVQQDMLYSWRVKTVCGTTSGSYSAKKYFSIFSGRHTQTHSTERLSYSEITDDLDELSLLAYPNPATENFKLYFNLDEESKVVVQLMDFGGRILSSEKINAIEGENNASVDVSHLTKGIYIAALKCDETISYKKILVQ